MQLLNKVQSATVLLIVNKAKKITTQVYQISSLKVHVDVKGFSVVKHFFYFKNDHKRSH